jgi:sec-independent protein translocase protein TatC
MSEPDPDTGQAESTPADPDGAWADDDDPSAAPLGDHIDELRSVVIHALIASVVGLVICFAFFAEQLVTIVLAPLQSGIGALGRAPELPGGGNVIMTTKLLDRFRITLIASLVGGVMLAAPYIAWRVWLFLRMGLTDGERRLVRIAIPSLLGFFFAGVAFGYFVMMPVALEFLLNYGGEFYDQAFDTRLILGDYISYFFVFTLIMGLIFQIPLIMTVLARVGEVNPAVLRGYRRHVIVGSLIVGMLLTPPDPLTQVMLAAPIAVLFELGLLMGGVAYRRRVREREAAMAGPNPWDEILGPQDPDFQAGSDGDDGDSDDDRPVPEPEPEPDPPADEPRRPPDRGGAAPVEAAKTESDFSEWDAPVDRGMSCEDEDADWQPGADGVAVGPLVRPPADAGASRGTAADWGDPGPFARGPDRAGDVDPATRAWIEARLAAMLRDELPAAVAKAVRDELARRERQDGDDSAGGESMVGGSL